MPAEEADEAALAFGIWDDGDGGDVADPQEPETEDAAQSTEADTHESAHGSAMQDVEACSHEPEAAGGEVKDAEGEGDDAPAAPAAKKVVKLKKSVTEKIRMLNTEANLSAPIRLGKVGGALSALDEASALEVLDRLLEYQDEYTDPTEWVCWAAKEKLAWNAWEKEQYEEWEAQQERSAEDRGGNLPEELKEAIREINRSGMLNEPLRMTWIAGPLSLLRPHIAMEIIKQLKVKAEKTEVYRPNGWVKNACLRRTSQVMERVASINKGGAGRMDLISPLIASQVCEPLHLLPEATAMNVLKELEQKAMHIEDPTSWVIEACKKRASPVAKRLLAFTEGELSKKLQKPLNAQNAMAALAPLEEKAALQILMNLEKMVAKIRYPQGWLQTQAQLKHPNAVKGAGKVGPPKGGVPSAGGWVLPKGVAPDPIKGKSGSPKAATPGANNTGKDGLPKAGTVAKAKKTSEGKAKVAEGEDGGEQDKTVSKGTKKCSTKAKKIQDEDDLWEDWEEEEDAGASQETASQPQVAAKRKASVTSSDAGAAPKKKKKAQPEEEDEDLAKLDDEAGMDDGEAGAKADVPDTNVGGGDEDYADGEDE